MLCGHVSPLALCFLFRRINRFLLLSLSRHQILVVVSFARPSKLRCPDVLSRGWFRKKRERKKRLLVGDLGPSGGTLHTRKYKRGLEPMLQKPVSFEACFCNLGLEAILQAYNQKVLLCPWYNPTEWWKKNSWNPLSSRKTLPQVLYFF